MTTVSRLDTAPISSKAVRLDNGWLRAPAHLARVGVLDYRMRDGSIRRELRLPDEVFHADALASFELVPLVDDHPYTEPNGALTGVNAKRHTVGSVGHVRADGDLVAATVLVHDAATVAKIDAGTVELSCGYVCDTEERAGEWVDRDGRRHRYDAIQRNIRGNHVALVQKGRAGPAARLHLDSDSAGVLVSSSEHLPGEAGVAPSLSEIRTMIKLNLDGIEVEVSDLAAQLLAKERNTATETLAAVRADAAKVKADADKATARADAADAKVAELQSKLDAASAPEAIAALVAGRVALEGNARKILGDDVKLDGLADAEIKAQVLAKTHPAIKLDGKSADYVDALFDAALAAPPAAPVNAATAEAAAKIAAGPRNDGAPVDPQTALRNAIASAHEKRA